MLPNCPALLSPFILLVATAYSGQINDDDDDSDDNALSPVHTGDYSRRIRRLSPKTATVAEFGDKFSPFPATMVASVDRAL